jgi:hypothetical protein
VGGYSRILAFLNITCPDTGCDPYDRVAWIQARHPGSEWTEIIRYITPFGRGCQHNIDLTEYMSLLQGEVELRFFIDTWAGGWEATVDLLFESGSPEFLYSEVDVLWSGSYDFGNPLNLQPLDTVNYDFYPNIDKADLNILISGHGWGQNNSENAAEFRETLNTLKVNGDNFQHVVWDHCNPNPDGCQPQNGTWQFSRSGWCPGAITRPLVFDLNTFSQLQDVEFIYQLDQSYTDFCHPNSIACVNGLTCPDCNAGFNPHYYIRGNLVSYSNNPIGMPVTSASRQLTTEAQLEIRPNPSETISTISWTENTARYLEVYSSDGKRIFITEIAKSTKQKIVDTGSWMSGIYHVRLVLEDGDGISGSLVKQ